MRIRRNRRRAWASLVCATLILLVAACQPLDPAAELAMATERFAARDFATAAVHINNVIQARPNDAAAHVLYAKIALALGNARLAKAQSDRAASLGAAQTAASPGAVQGDAALVGAEATLQLGGAKEALALLDRVASALERSADYWVLRARVELALGSLDDAEQALDRAGSLGAGAPSYELARAQLAALRGRSDEALAILNAALAKAPEDAALYVARAQVLVQGDQSAGAVADLTRAADLYRASGAAPLEASALFRLVQVNLAANDNDAAAAAANRLAKRAPQAAFTAYAKGLVEYRAGRLASAANELQKAVSAEPDNPALLTVLGAVQLALGNLGQAEQYLLQVVARSPGDPLAVKLLAETRLRQQRPEAALDALQPLAAAGVTDPQVGLLSGLASVLAGNPKQGVLYLEQAVALDPGNEMLKLQLARAYSAAGRASDGLELLRANFGAGSGNLEGRLVRLFGEARLGSTEQGKKAAADLLADFPRDARALTGAAMYYQLVGDARQMRALLEQAVAVDGRFVPARLLLAGALVSEGRSADAEQQLRQAHAIEPRNVQAVAALAQLAVARGSPDEAESLLREALAAAPVVPLQLMLAQLYVSRGQIAEAADLVAKAQAAAPDEPTVVAARGVLALVQGKLSDAVTLLTDAVARLPGRLDLVLALAQAEIGTNRAADAVKRLRRAVDAAPQSLPARLALGQAELRLGNTESAMKMAKALQAELPRQAGGYLLEADVDISRRQYDAAAESTRRAYEQDPSWNVANAVVLALQLARRPAEGLALVERWVHDHPDHKPGRLMLANQLQVAGRADEALREYDALLELDPNNVAALNNAAWLAQERGEPRALELAERAVKLAPDRAEVLDTLGVVLLGQKRDAGAVAHLEKAAKLDPKALEIRYHLAQALVQARRTDEARTTLEALLKDERPFNEKESARKLLESL
jgi:putative PEP-CTERM system TPR-repeat lipoprotein